MLVPLLKHVPADSLTELQIKLQQSESVKEIRSLLENQSHLHTLNCDFQYLDHDANVDFLAAGVLPALSNLTVSSPSEKHVLSLKGCAPLTSLTVKDCDAPEVMQLLGSASLKHLKSLTLIEVLTLDGSNPDWTVVFANLTGLQTLILKSHALDDRAHPDESILRSVITHCRQLKELTVTDTADLLN
jgi:hypothetical protein